MGMTHGYRLRTYKRECRRAFSQTLQVTLVMQPALARTYMCREREREREIAVRM